VTSVVGPLILCLLLIGDVVISAIFGVQPYPLTVLGGTANPAATLPGQVVTVTADANTDEEKFSYWTTGTGAVDIAVPTARSFELTMPSENVTLTVQKIKVEGKQ